MRISILLNKINFFTSIKKVQNFLNLFYLNVFISAKKILKKNSRFAYWLNSY